MKDKLNIKRLLLAAAFGSAIVVLTSTVGCAASRRAPNAEAAHTSAPGAAQACRANLRSIDGAKRVWALEHRKQDSEVPADADLFGPATYIREKPKCPSGGIYTINAVEDHPICSIPGHV